MSTTVEQGLSRRRFIRNAGLAAAAAWLPTFVVRPGTALAEAGPAGFPSNVELYRQAYENWTGEIHVDDAWTCAPRTPTDVVAVVNWARANGYRIRPQGMRHGWSPLTVANETPADARFLLVDTTRHMTAMALSREHPSAVDVQTGALMTSLLEFLEGHGLGFTAVPSCGEISVGGALAINAHGASLPARGESTAGRTYGSLSNRVLALTAVVWDPVAGVYALRRYDRRDPQTKALMTHLGRAFITDVTLQAGPNDNLRCISLTDIPALELFAAAGSPGRTFETFLDRAGRVEAIWFAFTPKPWLKVWFPSARKPSRSRSVSGPYNYPFADNVPQPIPDIAERIMADDASLTPLLGETMYEATVAGLHAFDATDLWGPSKDLLLYVKPSTIPERHSSLAVLTRRSEVQRVLHDYAVQFQTMLASYRSRGLYPINLGVELRVSGIDHPTDVPIAGAEPPSLSTVSPSRDHPEWDTAVWLSTLTLPGTPSAGEFGTELEAWISSHYTAQGAGVRPEWSKSWAYTNEGPWRNTNMIRREIPDAFGSGSGPGDEWRSAIATFDELDPPRIFSNTFLDTLLV